MRLLLDWATEVEKMSTLPAPRMQKVDKEGHRFGHAPRADGNVGEDRPWRQTAAESPISHPGSFPVADLEVA